MCSVGIPVALQDSTNILHISIDKLAPLPEYPLQCSNKEISELAASICENGLLEAITVFEEQPERYFIVSGYMRYLACLQMGYTSLPCIVCQCADHDDAVLKMLEALIIQRRELHISQVAQIAATMMDAHRHQGQKSAISRSNQYVAHKLHLTVNQVKDYVRIARLCPKLLPFVDESILSCSSASILSDLPEQWQNTIADLIGQGCAPVTCSLSKEVKKLYDEKLLTVRVLESLLKKQMPDRKPMLSIKFTPDELLPYIQVGEDTEWIKSQILSLLRDFAPVRFTNEVHVNLSDG